jgi:two-component sensor histidine kinase
VECARQGNWGLQVPTNGLNGLQVAELRHRLFGNFQLLQALISIRLRSVRDPESRRHLNWLTDVMAALALINRRLSATGVSDFGGYLIESVGFWRRVCAGREIGFALDAAAVPLPEAIASSLALIVHELMANAVEHAFPENRSGRIDITLSEAYGVLELTVRDNGVGRTLDVREGAEGIGLVRGLVEHLGGTFEETHDNGVTVTVRVPLVAAAARPPRKKH